MWANIRAKKARGGKPAKPGDEAYPDKKQWNKLSKQSEEQINNNMNTEQAYIEGFVKRASEYGFSESEATELLKTAMRGQNAYSLIENISRPLAAAAVREGLPSIPGRGTEAAKVLADLVRKVKGGRMHPSSSPIEQHRINNLQQMASEMLHP